MEQSLPQELPAKPEKKSLFKMDTATLIMLTVAGVLSVIAYRRGSDVFFSGLQHGGRTLLSVLPLLIAAFVVAGLAEYLIPRQMIASWLGGESGWRGIFIASGIGAITPGGPFVSYPLVAVLYKSGAGIGPIVAFVTAWSLWALTRLPLELAFVGPKLTFIRLASTLIFPPMAGWIAHFFFSR